MNMNAICRVINQQSNIIVEDLKKALDDARAQGVIDLDDAMADSLRMIMERTVKSTILKTGSTVERSIKQIIEGK